jgi:DNA-binding NarL/FixJ family response regulator
MLLVSATADADFAYTAIEAGVRGMVPTKATAADFLAAVHRVARGEYLLAEANDVLHGTPGALRPKEIVILRQVADGHPNRQIAAQLGISERTVGNHLTNIFTTLGVHNRVAAVERARRYGWLPGNERETRTHAE